jgi:F-box/leucine-rich repeat protein 14
VVATDEALQHVSDLHDLQQLVLDYGDVGDVGLQHLGKLTGLQELKFRGSSFEVRATSEGIRHLGSCTSLRHLSLEFPNLTSHGLRHLSLLTALQSLNLSGCSLLNDDGLVHLSTFVNLQQLNLRFCDGITDAGVRHAVPRRLCCLDVGYTLVSNEFLRELDPSYMQRLSFTGVTDEGLRHIGTLSALQELVLMDCAVTETGWKCLSRLASLRKFSMKLKDEDLRHVSNLVSLQELNLDNSMVADDGLSHVSKLLSLQKLGLSNSLITDQGLPHLFGLSLHELDLGWCKITANGMQSLQHLHSLRALNLYTIATDEGLQYVSFLPALQRLEICSCRYVTDAGLRHLSRLVALQTLLLRGNTNITDEGLQHLCLPNLQLLDLAWCSRVSDECVRLLSRSIEFVYI